MQDYSNSNLVIQLIGFVALGFMAAVFQANKRKNLLSLQATSALLFSLHFILLGAITGAVMNLLGAARSYTFLNLGKNRDIRFLFAFIMLFALATFVSWQGTKSLLPLTGMIFGTVAFWQTKPSKTRLIALLASPPWFIYSAITGSYPGMLVELIVFSSNLTGIYRLDLPKLSKRGG